MRSEVGDRLDHRDDQAQVGSCRRPGREECDGCSRRRSPPPSRLTFRSPRATCSPQPAVALHQCRRDRLLELLLDEAAHLQHAGTNPLQLVAVAAQDVMRQVRLSHDVLAPR